MQIRYIHGRKGESNSNILWSTKYPMRGGVFPKNHPIGGGWGPDVQAGESDNINAFRSKGYWASCFPEGGGITIDTQEKTEAEVVADIKECFGWEIIQERGK